MTVKIKSEQIESMEASKLTGVVPTDNLPPTPPIPEITADDVPLLNNSSIPAAVNSATEESGFGGFRYQVTGSKLELFTS